MTDTESTTQRMGYYFALGVLRCIGLWICIPLLAYGLAKGAFGLGMDDSDKSGWKRSGASIVTDHKTGLQYFVSPNGGITPRLTESGAQMKVTP